MVGSTYFNVYQQTLHRVSFSELLDEHQQTLQKRRLSIVGPCYTHEQWLAVHRERQEAEARKHAEAATPQPSQAPEA